MTQPSLFGPESPAARGARLRDRAIDRVRDHADPVWLAQATQALRLVVDECERFTTDQVWAVMDARGIPRPREARAMGTVMRDGVSFGWIEPTNEWILSARPDCHRRPVRVWTRARRRTA